MLDERSTPPSPPPAHPAPPVPLSHPESTTPPRRRIAWYWIALIIVCVALIPVLLFFVFTFPALLSLRKNANEASAVLAMRTIGQAQMQYNTAYPAYGYACNLATLGGDSNAGSPTAQSAQLIDPALAATGQKYGYTFAITCGTKVTLNDQDTYTSYRLTAVPLAPGKTGNRGYCSDEDNVVKFDPTGGTNCTHPLP